MYVWGGEYVQGKCPDSKDEVMREFCDKLSFWVCTTPIVYFRDLLSYIGLTKF